MRRDDASLQKNTANRSFSDTMLAMAAYDDLNNKRIFTVAFISVFVTAVTALSVQVLYYAMVQWQQAETAAESDYRRQNMILQEQSDEISAYGVNPESGNVVIPIDQAIEMIVKEQDSDQQANQTKEGIKSASTGGSDET